MNKFSNRLRELRNSKDLSQQQLADKIKTSKSSINMYERGEREPGLEMIETFADFFNVDLDYLLGKSDIPNKILSMNALSIKYNKLNTLGQKKTDEYMNDLLENPKYTKEDAPEKKVSLADMGTIAARSGKSNKPKTKSAKIIK